MIYVGQSKLHIEVLTGIDLTGMTKAEILYKKPVSGTEGAWVGYVVNAKSGIIAYDVTPALPPTLNEKGLWSLRARVTFSDGGSVLGGETNIRVS